jgi:uncharacterized protein (DUF433 family)
MKKKKPTSSILDEDLKTWAEFPISPKEVQVMENIVTQHIEITPGLRGGKPHLVGTRITVSDIALMHLKLRQTVPEIAADYDLNLASIYAALAYYYDHRAEIERQLDEDEAFVAAFRQQNPSKLQAKLRQLRHDESATPVSS